MKNRNSIQEILKLYSDGQRHFCELDIEGDFSNHDLKGISFDGCFITGYPPSSETLHTSFC